MESLRRLQDAIIAEDSQALKNAPLSGILEDSISDDLYGTLEFATSKERGGLMNADEMLIDAVDQTLERGDDILQIVGLAIKNGATPNAYVTVNFENSQGFEEITVIHIIVYAWRRYIETSVDYKNLLNVVGLLCAAGADVMLPVTDPKVLLERKRKENINVSAVDVMERVGKPKSVLSFILEEGKKQSDDDEEVSEGEEDEAVFLSDVLLRYIAVFTAFRNTLGDVKDIVRNNTFIARSINLKVFITPTEAEEMTDLAERIGLFLDNPYGLTGMEGDQKLLECVAVFANRCAKKLLESKTITVDGAMDAFYQAVRSFNGVAAKMIVEYGLFIRYNTVSNLIYFAKLKSIERLQLSAEFLTGILIMLVEHGSTLDREQLGELSTFSEASFNEIMDVQNTPYWRRACSAPGPELRSDVRQLARELNVDPGMDRDGLCEIFKKLSARKNVKSSAPPGAEECENVNILTRDISDYSDLDLTVIRDSNNKKYCFEAIDYPRIIRSGINAYTNNPITETSLEGMKAKYNTLMALGLPLESTGIAAAMEKLKRNDGGSADYELWVRARRDHFLNIIASPGIEISKEVFLGSERQGALTIEEMQDVINDVGQENRIQLSPMNNREHAFRDFAMTFMEYLDEEQQAEDPKAAVESLFARLKMAIDAITEPVSEEIEE